MNAYDPTQVGVGSVFCLVILWVGDGGGLLPHGWDFWDEARVVGAAEEFF